MMFIEALLLEPLVGLDPEDTTLVHKVTFAGLPPLKEWETAEWSTAVCGASVKLWRGSYKAARIKGTRHRYCQPCRRPDLERPTK